jgi:hypothetical protein
MKRLIATLACALGAIALLATSMPTPADAGHICRWSSSGRYC